MKDPEIEEIFYVLGDVHKGHIVFFDGEGKEPILSLSEAVALAEEFVRSYGGAQAVIECKCIKQVIKGKTWDPSKREELDEED